MRSEKSRLLDPSVRRLYTEALYPPIGFSFDGGIGTTYSLDLEIALTIPVCLALFPVENAREALANPIGILEATQRIAEKLIIIADAGRIADSDRLPALCGLLESVIFEASAPGGGAFHSKLWVLRYRSNSGDSTRLRLLIMSRNITGDRSWDVMMCLEGSLGNRTVAANKPVAELLRALPSLCRRSIPEDRERLANSLAADLQRTKWDLPEDINEVVFDVLGLSDRRWRPWDSDRLAVVSPFCEPSALTWLASTTKEPLLLVSRSEELDRLDDKARGHFRDVRTLPDTAESEDGEEISDFARRLRGLHAKIYVFDCGWDTYITVGSANASAAALLNAKNVEILATMIGRRSRLGDISSLFGEQGLGAALIPYIAPDSPPDVDPQAELAEANLELALKAILDALMRIKCVRQTDGEHWNLFLQCEKPVVMSGVKRAHCWIVTTDRSTARDLSQVSGKNDIHLCTLPLDQISGFVAFQLVSEYQDIQRAFTLNLPLVGLPIERETAIIRSIIRDQAAFMRYIRLLLADFLDLPDPYSAQGDGGQGRWNYSSNSADGILEDMVRAFAREPERLLFLDRMIDRLDGADGSIVPDDFKTLWDTFRSALSEKGP